MQMKKTSLKTTFLLAIAGVMFVSASASAVTTAFSTGNLLLGFRSSSAANSVIVNLGATSVFKNATGELTPIAAAADLDAQLATVFGANWYTDGSVKWGIVAGNNTVSTVDGEASGVLYGTREQATYGTAGSSFTRGTVSAQQVIGGNIASVGSAYAGQDITTPGLTQSNVGANTWNTRISATQFGNSAWNVEGVVGENSQLDLFRLAGSSSGAVGTYEGSFIMSSNGALSFNSQAPFAAAAVPEPSRALLLGLGLCGLLFRRRR